MAKANKLMVSFNFKDNTFSLYFIVMTIEAMENINDKLNGSIGYFEHELEKNLLIDRSLFCKKFIREYFK